MQIVHHSEEETGLRELGERPSQDHLVGYKRVRLLNSHTSLYTAVPSLGLTGDLVT